MENPTSAERVCGVTAWRVLGDSDPLTPRTFGKGEQHPAREASGGLDLEQSDERRLVLLLEQDDVDDGEASAVLDEDEV
jgi:hypothetical protein